MNTTNTNSGGWSPPLAGAWIEIKRDDDGQGLRRSPPLAGGVD